MEVHPVECLSDNYAYLLVDTATKQAMAVDPADAEDVIAAAAKLQLTIVAVLTTHHHFDHAGGNKTMKKMLPDIQIIGGEPNVQGMTRQVKDGEELPLGSGTVVRCLHTPCHTQGHTSYLATSTADGSTAVFTGDILFIGGCGRFFEGTPEQMVASAKTLAALPPQTKVYCGHEYTTKNLEFAYEVEPDNRAVIAKRTWAEETRKAGGRTVPSTMAEELTYNPFMRVGSDAVRAFTGASDDVKAMRILRNKKDHFAGSSRPWIPGGGPLPGL